MLANIGFIASGFVLGVSLTGIVACYVFGLLHSEAVRALEGYGMGLYTLPASSAQRRTNYGEV